MKKSQVSFIIELSKTNKKAFYFKNGEQKGKTGPIWDLVPVGGEKI
jgi:hypothetical protein